MSLFKSCSECTHKCCKTGPGPYTVLEPYEYSEIAGQPEGYNTTCKHFDMKKEICKIWSKKNVPLLCKTWICWLREYTTEELDNMKNLLGNNDIS